MSNTSLVKSEAHSLLFYQSADAENTEFIWNGLDGPAPEEVYCRNGVDKMSKHRVVATREGYVPLPGERVIAPITMPLVYASCFAKGISVDEAEALYDTFSGKQDWMIAQGEAYRRAHSIGHGWDDFDNAQTFVFHHSDPDGLCAAWAASQQLPNATFIPIEYGQVAFQGERVYQGHRYYDITDHTVIFLDFCPDEPDELALLCKSARHVVVIDHHKTTAPLIELELPRIPNLHVVWSLGHAACRLAYDFFLPNWDEHWLVNYVEDRDLWRWKLDGSRAMSAGIFAVPRTIPAWDKLADRSPESVHAEGEAILRSVDLSVLDAIDCTRRDIEWVVLGQTFNVAAVNSPLFRSEIGEVLAVGRDFSVVYYVLPSGRYKVSLRSTNGEGFPVSTIAVHFGGGGHTHAAGFECSELPWTI